MKKITLNGAWSLRGKSQCSQEENIICIDAQVPGCAQLDLSKAGYLPEDLFMGENILEAEKYEEYEWFYERVFDAPLERENVYLIFEGVDCLAEYFINGVKIGESDNMLIAHEFNVGKYLIDGENTLTVHISSSVLAAHDTEYNVNSMMSWENGTIETALRRAPHTYGWDIMPRALTAGIWRDVRLEVRDEIYFSQLFFAYTGTSVSALYELQGKFDDVKNAELVFRGICGDDSFFETRTIVSGKKAGRIGVNIKNPKKWWPYGYGEPNVYDVTASIYKDGKLIHEEKSSFGIRTVELERTDMTDGVNGKFRFLINGVEIMCKGSNWVPLDVFHCRDAERYEKALALVKDIGCNVLRCWGGNVYEDHAFFEFCDRNGIMVWQDFAMACRIYPETESYKKQLEAEATSVIRKLRNHPSIILWSGDNEIDLVIRAFADPSNNTLTREVLPRAVWQNDIGRPYLASSPYVSSEAYRSKNKELALPEDHLWGPRDYFKSDFYKNNKAHFVSETGYHGCPSIESIKKFITPDRVWPYTNNSEWILHSSDQNGNDKRVMLMEKQVRQLFGSVPTDPEEYVLASQISQAEAKKYFIERIRVGRPDKTGIIWWNLLDGWPQMSDAVVDYYFTKKIAYDYIKRSQAPFAVIADEISNWGLQIYACNDTLQKKRGYLTVKDACTDEIIYRGDFIAAINTSTKVVKLPTYYSEQKILIFEWEIDDKRGYNHYLCGYPSISLEMYKAVMKKYHL